MQHWFTATIIGIGLGLALYTCVRMRMHFGPIIRNRYGNLARRAYWLLTILVMVALANAGLLGLRRLLANPPLPADKLMLEIWFTLLATAVALTLIYRRLKPGIKE
jgi:hypothetical protein